MAMDDQELLKIVADEKRRSVGFDNNSDLITQRERALNYRKGEMSDVPSIANRSQAVSTDVDDTIQTLLPDIVEIFTGGEDVATFRPNGQEDEESAKQETDYVNHVVFNENDGFMILHTMFLDALQAKLGVVTWWAEEMAETEPKAYTNQPEASVAMVMQDGGQPLNLRPSEEQGPEPLYDFELQDDKPRQCVKIANVPPEDFAFASDTVRLRDTTYCAMRARPRAQDLLAQGIDPELVEQLPPYSGANDAETNARDTINEHDRGLGSGGQGDFRQVETVAHFIRVVEDGETTIWRVLTGHNEKVLLERKEVDEVTFAAITPYPVPHRLMGESLADKTMELQRINTALTRITLDAAYFALNQRMEVAEDQSSENTIPDLLRNEPGMPIRSKNGMAVKPIVAGGLGFDPFTALEYFQTVGERRTGVVRNAQGINPDTLHDTAKGAQVLMGASQKRVRLMARVFAETGLKDLFLGVHALLRRVGGVSDTIRLRNKWVDIDPTAWGQRNDMTIEIGVGSAGREQDLMAMGAVIEKQSEAVMAQGGSLAGPLVTASNLYASAIRYAEKAGLKNPEMFFTDPAEAQQAAPQPDPHAMAMQAQANADQAKLQLDQQKLQLEGGKAQAGVQMDQQKLQLDAERLKIEQIKVQLDAEDRAHARQMAEQKLMLDAQLGQSKLDSDNALKLAEMNAKYTTSVTVAQIKSDAEAFRAHADLIIQASEHQHTRDIADQAHDHALEQIDATPEPAKPAEGGQ